MLHVPGYADARTMARNTRPRNALRLISTAEPRRHLQFREDVAEAIVVAVYAEILRDMACMVDTVRTVLSLQIRSAAWRRQLP